MSGSPAETAEQLGLDADGVAAVCGPYVRHGPTHTVAAAAPLVDERARAPSTASSASAVARDKGRICYKPAKC